MYLASQAKNIEANFLIPWPFHPITNQAWFILSSSHFYPAQPSPSLLSHTGVEVTSSHRDFFNTLVITTLSPSGCLQKNSLKVQASALS